MLDILETLGLSPCATIAFAFLIFPYGLNSAFAQGQLNDPSLTIQVMVDGLASPTSLIFLDNNNILLLEKVGSDMNGITIGDEVHEDEMGPQDGDEPNEENG